jgi:GNAT superfamily N-acetyltransferase
MSRTINSIEINSISYTQLRTLMNNQPVQHLEEVPFGNFQLTLDLVHETYENMVTEDYGRCYSAHINGEYAGYMVVGASEMMHHRGIVQAITDSFYIAPAYRASGVFSYLLRYVEQDLKKNGIRFFTVGLNPNMPDYAAVTNYMCRHHYQHTEYLVTKEL